MSPNADHPFVLGFRAAEREASATAEPEVSNNFDGAERAAWLDGFHAGVDPIPTDDPFESGRRSASIRWAIQPYTEPAAGDRWYWAPPGTPLADRAAWLRGWVSWWDSHPVYIRPAPTIELRVECEMRLRRIEIDLNRRTAEGLISADYFGLEPAVGEQVIAYERGDRVRALAVVVVVDAARRVAELDVDWDTLSDLDASEDDR